MSPATHQTRELAARNSDGIHVRLLWHPDENAVSVSVEDARSAIAFNSGWRPSAPSMPSTTPSPTRPRDSAATAVDFAAAHSTLH